MSPRRDRREMGAGRTHWHRRQRLGCALHQLTAALHSCLLLESTLLFNVLQGGPWKQHYFSRSSLNPVCAHGLRVRGARQH